MDLDEFLANLGLGQDLPVDSPASAEPASSTDTKTNPADMDEEERREYMVAKRLDITSRHSRWESEVESLIEAKTTEVTQKVLKLREDGVHKVLEKDSSVQIRAEDMVKEGERLLKGVGSWVAAHKDAPYAQKFEVNADLQKEKDRDMDLFDKLVGKVQEKFRDKVDEIEDEVRVWYMGVRDAEIQEVSRFAELASISNFFFCRRSGARLFIFGGSGSFIRWKSRPVLIAQRSLSIPAFYSAAKSFVGGMAHSEITLP
ncbi:hypothetical protein IMY05_C4882000200 [Salix suchowensis]|nr:hypothetical protein IMY05_C4882000200 [Salix suchowensis]